MKSWFGFLCIGLGALVLLNGWHASAQDPADLMHQWAIPDAAHCPSTFDEANGASCPGKAEPFSCNYKGWNCQCQVLPYCGGAAPPPWIYDMGTMTCTPTDPKVLREDGCPWVQPKAEARCKSDPALECVYELNCSVQFIAQCTDDRWSIESRIVPPRP